jgi:hypothetical protein
MYRKAGYDELSGTLPDAGARLRRIRFLASADAVAALMLGLPARPAGVNPDLRRASPELSRAQWRLSAGVLATSGRTSPARRDI